MARSPLRWRLLLALAAIGAIAAALMLAVVRSPIDPLAYSPAAPAALAGPLEPNGLLREIELLHVGDAPGPEDVALDDRGRVYCGLADGTVRRSDPTAPDPSRFAIFATTGGRPQGLDFDARGTLWVADTRRGLLSIDREGRVAVRSTAAAGRAVGFANDVDVSQSDRVFFSDASTRFGPDELLLDVLEARPHGRLLEYDPATGLTHEVLDGLYFANGVAVAADDRFVLVAETFRYRIRRIWLRGPDAGRDEVLVSDLPGFPDGIASDGRGTFWVALYGLRSTALDRRVHPRPWLKRLIASLPATLRRGTKPYGLVVAIDGEGRILRSLHDPGGERIAGITSVEPYGARLYLGTVDGSEIGRYAVR